jgi:hypothetical protein
MRQVKPLLKPSFVVRATVTMALASAVAMIAPIAHAGTETVFPNSNRILTVVPPAQCKQWKAPLPTRQTNVAFPEDARGIKGDAALLVRIGANGEFLGVSDHLASDDAFRKAAEAAVKDWTFAPARCNGQPIASDARVDFEFRREGGITYKTGNSIGRQ